MPSSRRYRLPVSCFRPPPATQPPLNNFTRRAWEPLQKEAGIVTRRKMRSKLIEKGKDQKFIQTAMGHAEIQLTLNVYGHLLKDKEAEQAQTVEDLALEMLPEE
ncbi:tyrosine-type recombinase/integrase [Pseudochrobactrum kiredjianiae]|nr:tyrosine-type recombinase/integrase [Pseudochrobactrum kiredjianiae]MDM7852499.1 tyrosine-type recombinase/integrase [Pseudochrobactrum kiredjianiae]